MAKGTLIDTTKCIGCRSCQVTCKQWNHLPAEHTYLPDAGLGLQNPKTLSAKTLVVVQQYEAADDRAPGGIRTVFAKRQCMHCDEPACAAACPVTAMHKTSEGPVAYDSAKCIGCRYCIAACPFGVPTAEWDKLNPKINKCDMCYSRLHQQAPQTTNGQKLTPEVRKDYAAKSAIPSCVKQCAGNALTFGERDDLIAEARRRMKANPGKYVDHIYGEHEAGGTGMLYMAGVGFEQLGFPFIGMNSYVSPAATALSAVAPASITVGAALGGISFITKRRDEVAKAEAAAHTATPAREEPHVEFTPLGAQPFYCNTNKMLLAIMGFGALSFVLRFIFGLGGATGLSDTFPWGLWIIFDLVWIALAAGAFTTAGLIYVTRRKDLYPLGRSAVLLGLLSYSFVTVTLIADLGKPWNAFQLLINAPHHSAMYEVSWCISLYVTILALEFLPVALGKRGMQKYVATWQKYAPWYVVAAVTVFIFLMSHSLLWTALGAAVFSLLAYVFRAREGETAQPIMLAIAAVTFSTMHQSSLGSLFLLMPDKLSHLWWSPAMPVYFFLSAVVGGTAAIVQAELWIAKAYKRPLHTEQLAAMGQVTFWSLVIYEVFRLGDLTYRGQWANLLAHPNGLLLLEIIGGGLIPLVLLSSSKLRHNHVTLFLGTILAMFGVVFNRINVVVLGMTLKGPMPQIAPARYTPTVFEWGISFGLIAATVFLFRLGAQYLPVLPKDDQAQAYGD